jgi:mitogen-activated protein kinase 1/3
VRSRAPQHLKRSKPSNPKRPPAEEALADPYFANLHSPAREPAAQSVSRAAFEFERRKLAVEEVRELIYREILEYHPQARGGRGFSGF